MLQHGAINAEGGRTSIGELVVEENLSRAQEEELEADDFALACLRPEVAGLHNAWINIALHPQMLIDSLVSLRDGAHPLTANRLQRALRASQTKDNFVRGDKMEDHLVAHGAAFLQIEAAHQRNRVAGGVPLFDRLTRSDILGLLKELTNAFPRESIDLTIVGETGTGWRALAPIDMLATPN